MTTFTDDSTYRQMLQDPAQRNDGFRSLMKQYGQTLYWHIRRIVIGHDDAEDVLQETCIKVLNHIGSFKGDAPLLTWLYRIATNEALQKKFEPIYRSYCQEMRALWAERKRPIKPSTSTDAAAIAKRKMEMQQRAQGIRMKYIDKLATVLNADQVNRFFEVESIIQKKLKQRRDQARDQ